MSVGKRKSSLGLIESGTPEKRLRTDSSSNITASAPPSPWETKTLKADLIAAKAQVHTVKNSKINCYEVYNCVFINKLYSFR